MVQTKTDLEEVPTSYHLLPDWQGGAVPLVNSIGCDSGRHQQDSRSVNPVVRNMVTNQKRAGR